jgi:ribonuclease J
VSFILKANSENIKETTVKQKSGRRRGPAKTKTPCFRVIPLGGLGEIGKNFTVIECENDIIIIDCGIKFPDGDMYGVDFVIPDFSYLDDKITRVRGLFLTHGHEDHIGAIPFFLKRFGDIPIYGTKLTIGLLGNKLTEHRLENSCTLNVVNYGSVVKVEGFQVEFVGTNHSIPDSCALYIKCKGGTIFHTGDFKIDLTPVDNQRINLSRMAQIGDEGVDLLISDSTNAQKKGFTPSETTIGESFNLLFAKAGNKRIVVASFATNVHRIQQIFDAAKTYKRKVVVSGRSMVNVIKVARELKYLKFKDSILVDLKDVNSMPHNQIVLLTTGSQGEPMSVLSRMASNDHRLLKITEDDFVIISATPIPGNEKTVGFVINDLMKLGAEVIYQGASDVHVSGHACQEELKLIQVITKPKNFMPCHGEYRMLVINASLAEKTGVNKDHIFVMENGDVLEICGNKAYVEIGRAHV